MREFQILLDQLRKSNEFISTARRQLESILLP